MGESSEGIDGLRFVYFTGDNGSITHGPKCHLCMNQSFQSNGLDQNGHVFIVVEGGLVPFLTRSLVFLYGPVTPFSLKDVYEPHLMPQCTSCPSGYAVSSTEDFKFCGNIQETSQTELAITPGEKRRRISYEDASNLAKRVKIEVVEVLDPGLTLTWGNLDQNEAQNLSIKREIEEEVRNAPSVLLPVAAVEEPDVQQSSTAITISPSLEEGEILDVSNDAGTILDSVEEPSRIIASTSLNAHCTQQDSQPSTSKGMPLSPVERHVETEEPSYVNLLPIVNCKSEPSTSALEGISEQPDEWFPFMHGRCPITVADPIASFSELNEYAYPIKSIYFKDKNLMKHVIQKYFKDKNMRCAVCNLDLSQRPNFLSHFLDMSHFLKVTSQREVFSKFFDLRKLWELCNDAKWELMDSESRIKYKHSRTELGIVNILDPTPISKKTIPTEMPVVTIVEDMPAQVGEHDTGELPEAEREIASVQHDVSESVEEESMIIEPSSIDASCPLQQDSQPSTSNNLATPSDKSLFEPDGPSDETPHPIAKCNRQPSNSSLRQTLEQSDEWFPFLKGRNRSTVTDPIDFDSIQSFITTTVGDNYKDDFLIDRMVQKHFKNRETMYCHVCNTTIYLRRDGFAHLLSKDHFQTVTNRNEVFSKYMDLRIFGELVREAKHTVEKKFPLGRTEKRILTVRKDLLKARVRRKTITCEAITKRTKTSIDAKSKPRPRSNMDRRLIQIDVSQNAIDESRNIATPSLIAEQPQQQEAQNTQEAVPLTEIKRRTESCETSTDGARMEIGFKTQPGWRWGAAPEPIQTCVSQNVKKNYVNIMTPFSIAEQPQQQEMQNTPEIVVLFTQKTRTKSCDALTDETRKDIGPKTNTSSRWDVPPEHIQSAGILQSVNEEFTNIITPPFEPPKQQISQNAQVAVLLTGTEVTRMSIDTIIPPMSHRSRWDIGPEPIPKAHESALLNVGSTMDLNARTNHRPLINIKLQPIQTGILKSINENSGNIATPPSMVEHSQQQQHSQASSSNYSVLPSYQANAVPVNTTPIKEQKWFPFLAGCCPSTVSDPICSEREFSVHALPLRTMIEEDTSLLEFMLKKYFKPKKEIPCSACNTTVSLRAKGFEHFLAKRHFNSVTNQYKMFSKSMDFQKFQELLNDAKLERSSGKSKAMSHAPDIRGPKKSLHAQNHLLHLNKQIFQNRPLFSDSRLPFGYGTLRSSNSHCLSFEDIFNFMLALKMTGKLDSGFHDFLALKYREIADVNFCRHCGPLDTAKNIAISHFLTLSHIVKAMEVGQVFVLDSFVLKNLFGTYLVMSNCKGVGDIVRSVDEAIKEKIYSKQSPEFSLLSDQIREAIRKSTISISS